MMNTKGLTILLALGACSAIATGATPPPAAKPAAKPPVTGKVCKLEISGTDAMQFDKKELAIAADCKVVQLTLRHSGKLPISAMGHNWVLTKTADVMPVNNAGLTAGMARNHVPPGDKRVIAFTPVVGGGQSTSISFPTTGLVKGGDYTFFCSFPGHIGLMRGKFLVQ
jgi:azurin